VTFATGGSPVLGRVDLRTGATLWSRRVGPTGYLDAGDPAVGGPSGIVTGDQRGRVTVINFDDGAILANADLGVSRPA
jgi:hypothetical protein